MYLLAECDLSQKIKHICLVDRADISLAYSSLSKEKHKADGDRWKQLRTLNRASSIQRLSPVYDLVSTKHGILFSMIASRLRLKVRCNYSTQGILHTSILRQNAPVLGCQYIIYQRLQIKQRV